ncbi:UPF0158 family protein [Paenisporosarcina sp. NPDC076898]|uniref:UPF0158 family protein n=1 Tax=unclassified Paenisporosarcina TaxID=2642018 RepID=UPI003D0214EF
MKITQELIDRFLTQEDELHYVLNRITGEIILDVPESMTGEPEIDWDDEENEENLIMIPQISSSEAFEVMVLFAETQVEQVRNELLTILNGKKPFRNFKDRVQFLGLEESWYCFENEYAKNVLIQWLEEHDMNENDTFIKDEIRNDKA